MAQGQELLQYFEHLVPVYYTGCVICLGTTFGGCTEPQSDLTKILFSDHIKIVIKTYILYKIYF